MDPAVSLSDCLQVSQIAVTFQTQLTAVGARVTCALELGWEPVPA